MADVESLLNRWLSAGVLGEDAVTRIRAYESQQQRPAGVAWQGRVALILGGILLASGIALFVSAHWDQLGPGGRFSVVMAMVAVFHVAGGMVRERYSGLSTVFHAVGTVATGAAIALVGQIFNIQEHWPAAILLWAIAAFAGWVLLRDEAQQTLTLLLFPAWIFSEWSYAAARHIGAEVYLGRFLIVWSVLYFTIFLGSPRKVVQGLLFAAATIAIVTGIVFQLDGWIATAWSGSFLPPHLRFWGWVEFAVLPLFFAFFGLRKSLLPVVVSLVFAVALPWCTHTWTEHYDFGPTNHGAYTRTDPNLLAHALVAAFCVFMIWWGVRQTSRALVNLSIVGFGATVAWFYFGDLYDKMGRSLGLIGLGFLFLAGGWVLEKTRRSLIAHMQEASIAHKEAQ
jgi:uncharacterized membrane protein